MPKADDYVWPTNATERRLLRDGESGVEASRFPTAAPTESHAQHMPLPWRVFGRRDQAVADANGDGVAWCAAGNDPVCEANAAFIVTAVNAHEELLDALRALLQWVEIETDGRDWPHAHLIAARDAITKAEGAR